MVGNYHLTSISLLLLHRHRRYLMKTSKLLFPLSNHTPFSSVHISTQNQRAKSGGRRVRRTNRRIPDTNDCRKDKAIISQFRQLHRKGPPKSISSFTILNVLKALRYDRPSLQSAQQIQALIIHLGLDSIIFLQSSLINLYSSIGRIEDANKMFEGISQPNAVCWTALVSANVNNGRPKRALAFFRKMQVEGVEPDQIAITTVLSACADLGALEMGEWIHTYIRRNKGLQGDLILNNALINMYPKCGDIEKCLTLFGRMEKRDVTTWTSVIVGLALHGRAEEALRLFATMKEENSQSQVIVPNKVTFIGVLMACSHAGLVEEGRQQLESMRIDYGLKPEISHLGCMVDLLCRAGLLQEALDFIESMPVMPNAVIWHTLLRACSLHGKVDVGGRARQRLQELEPGCVGDDVVMANTFAAAEMWDEKENVRKKDHNRRRIPGSSMIEVESDVHEFVASDKSHPRKKELFAVIRDMTLNMRDSSNALDYT